MRHWGLAGGLALGAALGVALGLTEWPLDPARLGRGLDPGGVALEARAMTLRLLPRPTLTLKSPHLSAAGGALTAAAEDAQVILRLDRFVSGRFAPLALRLHSADLSLNVDAAARALPQLDAPPLTRLVIAGGALSVFSARDGWRTEFDLASARLDWPAAGAALTGSARGRWRGQPVEATLSLADPLAAIRGETSAFGAAVNAPLAQFNITGDWRPGASDGVSRGQVGALIPSLDRFARWIGRSPPETPSGLEMSARLTADSTQARLSEMELKLGGQPFEGAIDVTRNPQGVALSGTLAADSIDLAPLIGPPPAILDDNGGWSPTAVTPRPMSGVALDLRVSAAHATWGRYALDNAAAAVSASEGRFGVRLLEAGFAHGALSGELGVDERDAKCETRLTLALENADFGALLAQFGERHFSGQGGLKLTLKARGRSPREIVASASGDGAVDISDGGLNNVNFEEALRRAQRRLIDVGHDMNAGATQLGTVEGRVEISEGEARFVHVVSKAPGVVLALSGAADLARRAWRAQISARQASAEGAATPDGAHLDFSLGGPWSAPVFAPLLPPAD